MTVAEFVAAGRSAAEALMLDTCTITRPDGTVTVDPDTGLPTSASPTTIYAGKCKIQSQNVETLNPNSGDHVYTVDRWMIHIPVSATGVEVGDQVTITASALDSANVGRRFQVLALFRKTMATAQRLPVEEVIG